MHICMHGPYSPPFFPDPLDFLVLMLMMMMLEGYNIYICIYICYSTYQESGAEIIIPAPDHGNAVKYCTQHLLPPSRCSKHDFRPTVTRPFAYLTSQLSSLFSVNGFPTFLFHQCCQTQTSFNASSGLPCFQRRSFTSVFTTPVI